MNATGDALETRLHDLGEFIRDQRRNARLSLRKLSEVAGISNPYLSQIERGLRKPSAEILQAIAKGLRISAETLYVRAGILDERDRRRPGPRRRRSAATRRSPSARSRSLVEIYRSFQTETAAAGDELGRAAPEPPPAGLGTISARCRSAISSADVRCAVSPSSACTRRRSRSRARATAAA